MMKCQKISLIFFSSFQQYVESLFFLWCLWLPRSILVFSDMYFFEFFHKIFVLFNLLPALFRKKLKNIWQLDRQLYKSVTVFLFLCHNHKIYSKFYLTTIFTISNFVSDFKIFLLYSWHITFQRFLNLSTYAYSN